MPTTTYRPRRRPAPLLAELPATYTSLRQRLATSAAEAGLHVLSSLDGHRQQPPYPCLLLPTEADTKAGLIGPVWFVTAQLLTAHSPAQHQPRPLNTLLAEAQEVLIIWQRVLEQWHGLTGCHVRILSQQEQQAYPHATGLAVRMALRMAATEAVIS